MGIINEKGRKVGKSICGGLSKKSWTETHIIISIMQAVKNKNCFSYLTANMFPFYICTDLLTELSFDQLNFG